MWNSLPTALVVFLLLSDPVLARRRKRAADIEACAAPTLVLVTVTEGSLEGKGIPPPTALPASSFLSFPADSIVVLPTALPASLFSTFSAVPLIPTALPASFFKSFPADPVPSTLPAVIYSTATVIPMPMGTIGGVTYSGVPIKSATSTAKPTNTDIPAGIFYPGSPSGSGVASGSGTGIGSSGPRPTGLVGPIPASNRTQHHPVGSRPDKVSSKNTPPFTLQAASSTTILPTDLKVNPTTSIEISASTLASASPVQTTKSIAPIVNLPPIISTPLPNPAAISPHGPAEIPFLRGVNLGGWLVLEKWMNADCFSGSFSSAVDQFTFDSMPNSATALKTHWDTFFTEDDIKTIAATGINALRIPIGFWAYDNADTPYISGADAYLEKAIEWARNAGMKVWVDCHGSPGSQNGFDNSGHAGEVDWQSTANLERSISVLKTMATKYGAASYADVVVGLELVNEPISYGANHFSTTQSWAQDAYTAVKAVTQNKDMVIVMHDAFQGPEPWMDIASGLVGGGKKTFGIDTHLYQLYTDADNLLTQAQHITTACAWSSSLSAANAIMPTYVGEFSAATNICVNPDGSTTAGTSCSVDGCQCQSAPFDDWNDAMKEQVRRYVEAQLDVFEGSSSGYFMWSAKGPGGWGFLNGIANGAIPNPVTSRTYPGQCGGGKSRRGMVGVGGEKF